MKKHFLPLFILCFSSIYIFGQSCLVESECRTDIADQFVCETIVGGTFFPDTESCSVLPVELLSFKAIPKNEAILLEWATASEINNDYFVLEKSSNGKQFQPITKIQGTGTTLVPQKYNFRDESPLKGDNYYRLKQVDFDGMFEYSEIVISDWEKEAIKDFQFFPSPARNYITIQTEQTGRFQMFDAVGQVVFEQHISDSERINISSFPSGLYFLWMNGRGKILMVE